MAQGIPYYNKIVETYPSIYHLANADEDSLFQLWKGLGYYSRARNLHFTAKYIVNELKGKFPRNYHDLLKLKGVGEYTAAAIASFAFGENVAVLDGNVHRVLSRVLGINKTIQSSLDKQFYQSIANQLIFERDSALYNQLMMDLGSQICTPMNPQCADCSFSSDCFAFKNSETANLPPKKQKLKLKERYFYCLFVEFKGKIYLEKRTQNDIWKGLYQGLLQEGEKLEQEFWKMKNIDMADIQWSEWQTQILSHQKIYMKIGLLNVQKINLPMENFHNKSEIPQIAFPRVVSRWWENLVK